MTAIEAQPPRPNKGARCVRRLLGLTLPERARVTAALALTLIAVGLSVIGPLLIGRAVDTIFGGAVGAGLDDSKPLEVIVAEFRDNGQDRLADMLARMEVVPGMGVDFQALGTLVLLVIGLYLASALAEFLYSRLLSDAANEASRRLRTMVEDKVHRLPTAYLDGTSRGDLLSRMTNDVDNVTKTLSQTVSQLLVACLSVVGVLVMMVFLSPVLTLVALAVVPVVAIVTRMIMKRSQPLFIEQWTRTGELNSQIEEACTGHELVTQYGQREAVLAQFDSTNEQLAGTSHRAQFLSGLVQPVMVLLSNLSFVIICVVGAMRVLSGQMTLGGVTAFVQYSQQLSAPLSQIASMVNMVQSGLASAERVFDLLDLPEEPADLPGTLPVRPRGRVVFEQVRFDYGAGPVLEEVDLTVEPGSTVALVGPTGAGKTTLINLLLRFHEPLGGRITLDGTDIATVPRAELRDRCGLVLQDNWLFHGTIRENIAYGNPGATDAQIQQAAEAAHLDHFVRALPDTYDTVIDDGAANLSAGERQLIAIARALVKDPTVLVLDEATSSVDTRTEVHVQQAFSRLRSNRTAFVVAHRLSTIRDADLIVVLDGGGIVERGNHEELVAAGGAYHRLYQEQFRGPELTEDAMPEAVPAHA